MHYQSVEKQSEINSLKQQLSVNRTKLEIAENEVVKLKSEVNLIRGINLFEF